MATNSYTTLPVQLSALTIDSFTELEDRIASGTLLGSLTATFENYNTQTTFDVASDIQWSTQIDGLTETQRSNTYLTTLTDSGAGDPKLVATLDEPFLVVEDGQTSHRDVTVHFESAVYFVDDVSFPDGSTWTDAMNYILSITTAPTDGKIAMSFVNVATGTQSITDGNLTIADVSHQPMLSMRVRLSTTDTTSAIGGTTATLSVLDSKLVVSAAYDGSGTQPLVAGHNVLVDEQIIHIPGSIDVSLTDTGSAAVAFQDARHRVRISNLPVDADDEVGNPYATLASHFSVNADCSVTGVTSADADHGYSAELSVTGASPELIYKPFVVFDGASGAVNDISTTWSYSASESFFKGMSVAARGAPSVSVVTEEDFDGNVGEDRYTASVNPPVHVDQTLLTTMGSDMTAAVASILEEAPADTTSSLVSDYSTLTNFSVVVESNSGFSTFSAATWTAAQSLDFGFASELEWRVVRVSTLSVDGTTVAGRAFPFEIAPTFYVETGEREATLLLSDAYDRFYDPTSVADANKGISFASVSGPAPGAMVVTRVLGVVNASNTEVELRLEGASYNEYAEDGTTLLSTSTSGSNIITSEPTKFRDLRVRYSQGALGSNVAMTVDGLTYNPDTAVGEDITSFSYLVRSEPSYTSANMTGIVGRKNAVADTVTITVSGSVYADATTKVTLSFPAGILYRGTDSSQVLDSAFVMDVLQGNVGVAGQAAANHLTNLVVDSTVAATYSSVSGELAFYVYGSSDGAAWDVTVPSFLFFSGTRGFNIASSSSSGTVATLTAAAYDASNTITWTFATADVQVSSAVAAIAETDESDRFTYGGSYTAPVLTGTIDRTQANSVQTATYTIDTNEVSFASDANRRLISAPSNIQVAGANVITQAHRVASFLKSTTYFEKTSGAAFPKVLGRNFDVWVAVVTNKDDTTVDISSVSQTDGETPVVLTATTDYVVGSSISYSRDGTGGLAQAPAPLIGSSQVFGEFPYFNSDRITVVPIRIKAVAATVQLSITAASGTLEQSFTVSEPIALNGGETLNRFGASQPLVFTTFFGSSSGVVQNSSPTVTIADEGTYPTSSASPTTFTGIGSTRTLGVTVSSIHANQANVTVSWAPGSLSIFGNSIQDTYEFTVPFEDAQVIFRTADQDSEQLTGSYVGNSTVIIRPRLALVSNQDTSAVFNEVTGSTSLPNVTASITNEYRDYDGTRVPGSDTTVASSGVVGKVLANGDVELTIAWVSTPKPGSLTLAMATNSLSPLLFGYAHATSGTHPVPASTSLTLRFPFPADLFDAMDGGGATNYQRPLEGHRTWRLVKSAAGSAHTVHPLTSSGTVVSVENPSKDLTLNPERSPEVKASRIQYNITQTDSITVRLRFAATAYQGAINGMTLGLDENSVRVDSYAPVGSIDVPLFQDNTFYLRPFELIGDDQKFSLVPNAITFSMGGMDVDNVPLTYGYYLNSTDPAVALTYNRIEPTIGGQTQVSTNNSFRITSVMPEGANWTVPSAASASIKAGQLKINLDGTLVDTTVDIPLFSSTTPPLTYNFIQATATHPMFQQAPVGFNLHFLTEVGEVTDASGAVDTNPIDGTVENSLASNQYGGSTYYSMTTAVIPANSDLSSSPNLNGLQATRTSFERSDGGHRWDEGGSTQLISVSTPVVLPVSSTASSLAIGLFRNITFTLNATLSALWTPTMDDFNVVGAVADGDYVMSTSVQTAGDTFTMRLMASTQDPVTITLLQTSGIELAYSLPTGVGQTEIDADGFDPTMVEDIDIWVSSSIVNVDYTGPEIDPLATLYSDVTNQSLVLTFNEALDTEAASSVTLAYVDGGSVEQLVPVTTALDGVNVTLSGITRPDPSRALYFYEVDVRDLERTYDINGAQVVKPALKAYTDMLSDGSITTQTSADLPSIPYAALITAPGSATINWDDPSSTSLQWTFSEAIRLKLGNSQPLSAAIVFSHNSRWQLDSISLDNGGLELNATISAKWTADAIGQVDTVKLADNFFALVADTTKHISPSVTSVTNITWSKSETNAPAPVVQLRSTAKVYADTRHVVSVDFGELPATNSLVTERGAGGSVAGVESALSTLFGADSVTISGNTAYAVMGPEDASTLAALEDIGAGQLGYDKAFNAATSVGSSGTKLFSSNVVARLVSASSQGITAPGADPATQGAFNPQTRNSGRTRIALSTLPTIGSFQHVVENVRNSDGSAPVGSITVRVLDRRSGSTGYRQITSDAEWTSASLPIVGGGGRHQVYIVGIVSSDGADTPSLATISLEPHKLHHGVV